MQFQWVCKSWNSLISDPKFAQKHLRFSTTNLAHIFTYPRHLSHKCVLKSYPLDPVFTDVTTNHIAQLEFYSNYPVYYVASCNGILSILASRYAAGFVTVQLWNSSIRKYKEFPSLEKIHRHIFMIYGFGYDFFSIDYKVVVVLRVRDYSGKTLDKQEVKVLTLGTNPWKSIQKFPFCYVGKNQRFIVSFDLGNESYKEILLPDDYERVSAYIGLHLGVLRDYLCLACGHDVWVMKEHGNKDSWTKLFTISYMPDFHTFHATIEVLHIFEDGQVLLKSVDRGTWKLIFYNSRNGTVKFTDQFENISEVCVESLISPSF